MSVTTYLKEKGHNTWERFKWETQNNSIFNALFMPFWMVMRRERGTEFPFYFPNEKHQVDKGLSSLTDALNNFVHHHETERYHGDPDFNLYRRILYVARNFVYYSNDTMANLLYSTKLPKRDFERIKHTYLQYHTGFLLYNTLSGVFLVALNNYFFRTRKATIPVVLLASVTTYILFSMNYKVSYFTMDGFFNQYVRRLGYQHLIHRNGSHYPRNVDYLDI